MWQNLEPDRRNYPENLYKLGYVIVRLCYFLPKYLSEGEEYCCPMTWFQIPALLLSYMTPGEPLNLSLLNPLCKADNTRDLLYAVVVRTNWPNTFKKSETGTSQHSEGTHTAFILLIWVLNLQSKHPLSWLGDILLSVCGEQTAI